MTRQQAGIGTKIRTCTSANTVFIKQRNKQLLFLQNVLLSCTSSVFTALCGNGYAVFIKARSHHSKRTLSKAPMLASDTGNILTRYPINTSFPILLCHIISVRFRLLNVFLTVCWWLLHFSYSCFLSHYLNCYTSVAALQSFVQNWFLLEDWLQ